MHREEQQVIFGFVRERRSISSEEAATLPSMAQFRQAFRDCANAVLKRADALDAIAFSPEEQDMERRDVADCRIVADHLTFAANLLEPNNRILANLLFHREKQEAIEEADMRLDPAVVRQKKKQIDADYASRGIRARFLREAPEAWRAAYEDALSQLVAFKRSGDFALYSRQPERDDAPFLSRNFMYSSFEQFLPKSAQPITQRRVTASAVLAAA
jgi:hypothetical protein